MCAEEFITEWEMLHKRGNIVCVCVCACAYAL